MRKKSNKLIKLEKSRYSIFTDNFNNCYYCNIHKWREQIDLHEVYGGSNRQRSIKYGLVVPLCRRCHSNEMIIQDLRKVCQRQYEQKGHSREEFIKLIGKNYLV